MTTVSVYLDPEGDGRYSAGVNAELTADTPSIRDRLRVWLITFALTCGVVATGFLSFERLFHTGLPGCGVGSGCAAAAESPFARIHRMPVAHPGFAFATAIALTWIASGCRATRLLVWAARAGALVSAAYLILIIEHDYHCGYCTVAHFANLTVWVLLEQSPRTQGWRFPIVVLITTFGLILAGIAIVKSRIDQNEWEDRERQTDASIEAIVSGTGTDRWLPVQSTGGILVGPTDARIRITVFLDYQCGYCRTVAREVAEVAGLQGVSIVWRQLPHGWPCNLKLKSNMHDCACRCARMATATAGTPDFERVHRWLLERGGNCSEDDIEAALPGLISGDPLHFWARYHAPATRDAIRVDLELADRLNLAATPAVFINGVLMEIPNIGAIVRRIAERLPPTP